ncbi:SDR family NAD(P)-dependent oxidoreductase [Cognaticolwellia aestuarii]|jgi:NAD(P)-dependent dehydrogenase (short-subunit alcohol dehydrogenase family)|uniref:SDR family NAD(P)-dependent oxidoreductase n=1 Tax=Cognaticolwellia aestuarii TaxID=329993 RepID=UPI000984B7A4|nr:SDR family NAD(P)-dependent oxidoreductase [Cognaticolwellia aestuarii]
MTSHATLIIGANSEIAKAIAAQVINNDTAQLIVISRDCSFYQQDKFADAQLITLENYQEQTISQAVETLKANMPIVITQVFICHGILHNERCQPEKRLEDFSADMFIETLTANTVTPMLWLKHLTPLLATKHECKVVIFSARVGSISDNKLGGWYSYRASKAAMNMLITSAAVELARRAKNMKLISFHPGTTDSPLSKPFQKNVPKGKLFNSEFVASRLLTIVASATIDGQASYLDWQGKEIPW